MAVSSVRRADLLMALAYATDLAAGQARDFALRSCVCWRCGLPRRWASTSTCAAKRNGKQVDVLCCIVFELENGRIVIGREHFYDLYAWDAFWS